MCLIILKKIKISHKNIYPLFVIVFCSHFSHWAKIKDLFFEASSKFERKKFERKKLKHKEQTHLPLLPAPRLWVTWYSSYWQNHALGGFPHISLWNRNSSTQGYHCFTVRKGCFVDGKTRKHKPYSAGDQIVCQRGSCVWKRDLNAGISLVSILTGMQE